MKNRDKKTIHINNLKWKVYFVGKDNNEIILDGDLCMGITKFMELKIFIQKGMLKSLIERTIRHELTHAYLYSYGINKDEYSLEEVCNFVETYGKDIEKHTQELISNHYD